MAVREEKGQEHQDYAEPRRPDPLRQPRQLRSQGERAGIREERIDGVLLSRDLDPIEEGGGQEEPSDGVLGAVRGDEGPDDGERHNLGEEGGYWRTGPGQEDLTQGEPVEESEDQACHGQRHAQQHTATRPAMRRYECSSHRLLDPCSLAPSVTTPLYSTTVSQALRQTLRGKSLSNIDPHHQPRGHGGGPRMWRWGTHVSHQLQY